MRKGEKWERILEGYHKAYEALGVAWIMRAHPGVRQDQDGRMFYESEGPPDFFGYIPEGSVIFDAKEVRGPTFPVKNLKPHQAKAFAQAEKFGALAFLAIRCSDGDFVVLWRSIREKWAAGKGAFKVKDVGLPFDGNGWFVWARNELWARKEDQDGMS